MKDHREKILLFGSTGFVGSKIIEQLISDGYDPIVVTRAKRGDNPRIIEIEGTLDKPHDLKEQIEIHKPTTLIYLIGIIKENKKRGITFKKMHFEWFVVACKLARELGIKRVILMSANGASQNGTPYQTSKYLAEEYLKKSDFNWTIFRPSIIADRDDQNYNFLNVLNSQLRFPIVPIIGNGTYKLTPVARGDIAMVFSKAVLISQTFLKTYEIGGPQTYSYQSLIKRLADIKKQKVLFIHIPKWIIQFSIFFFGWLSFFPITGDQLKMLLEGNEVNDNSIWKTLEITPQNLDTILSKYKKL